MAVAHVTSLAGAEQALRAGVDGLVHIFFDRPPTDEIIAQALDAGVFITPTLSTVGSLASDIDGTTSPTTTEPVHSSRFVAGESVPMLASGFPGIHRPCD